MTFRPAARRALTGVAALTLAISTLGVVAPAANAATGPCPVDSTAARNAAHPGVDWYGCNLAGFDLSGVWLYNSNLTWANLTGVNLSGAVLDYSMLTGSDLTGANLTGASFYFTGLANTNMFGANVTGTSFDYSTMSSTSLMGAQSPIGAPPSFMYASLSNNTSFDGASIPGAYFNNASLDTVTFGSLTDLTGAQFSSATLSAVDFSGGGVSLTAADFTYANISGSTLATATAVGSTFAGATISNVYFMNTDLTGAIFTNTTFMSADFTNANLQNADFSKSSLGDITYSGSLHGTKFDNSTLSNVRFTNVGFSNASFVNTALVTGYAVNSSIANSTFLGATGLDPVWDQAGSNLWTLTICPDGTGNAAHVGASCAQPLLPDTTPPTVTGTITSGTVGGNGWYTTPATVHWTCADNVGVATCPADTTLSTDGGNQTITSGGATDAAGNTATGTVTGVNLDTTGPNVNATVTSGTFGNNGWYTTPVTVHWTCTDVSSGLATCPADTVLSTDGANQTAISGLATDNAGNTAPGVITEIKVDTTAPTVTSAVTSTGPTSTVTWTCSDATSGVVSCPAPETVTTLGASVLSHTVSDYAGNTTTATATVTNVPIIVITPTPTVTPTPTPTITPTPTPTPTPTVTPTPTPTPTPPPVVTKPVVAGVVAGHTYPYGTVLAPKCSATSTKPGAMVTCAGVTKTSLNGRVHTFTATVKTTVAGVTTTSTSTITWYTAAKPVVAVSPIHFPAGLRHTTTGMPVVFGGGRYTLTITVPRGAKAPLWLYSVRTNSRGTTGTPTVRQRNVTFHQVNATTWRVLFTPNRVTFAQYRKFGIKINGRTYTATVYVR